MKIVTINLFRSLIGSIIIKIKIYFSQNLKFNHFLLKITYFHAKTLK